MKYLLVIPILMIAALAFSVQPTAGNEVFAIVFTLSSLILVPALLAYSLKICFSQFRLTESKTDEEMDCDQRRHGARA